MDKVSLLFIVMLLIFLFKGLRIKDYVWGHDFWDSQVKVVNIFLGRQDFSFKIILYNFYFASIVLGSYSMKKKPSQDTPPQNPVFTSVFCVENFNF